ncbi:YHS domain-containing (seleno)protein [Ferruginibacter sp. HRS2-29]|uniref:YHS domain-containing (seleno)protein n=1 Tax=Ferruginibacter sp. HRS2-29 TaxID=2487334 RepID=UPI0020CBAD28|nr:YHS domain-containing (seleno)protein [Ferruginibacter sp. HRS2-29]MCP9753527.1 YHS domain protein [Ferruginibacter sp. HRS2-29]
MNLKKYVFVFLTLLYTNIVSAQNTAVFATDGVAIRGYDAVAYFTDNQAVKGVEAFSYQWNNARWLFKNNDHLLQFIANPEKYAPQYGGYCAYGLSENHASPTSPEAFTIVDDKLYLNYSLKVKQLWLKDQQERIQKANAFWPGLKINQ